jgi:hypothetical protein
MKSLKPLGLVRQRRVEAVGAVFSLEPFQIIELALAR